MSNPSLFDNNQNNGGATPPQENNPLPSDDLSTLLSGIKNERGEQKYKDVKTALEALKHSQEYIPEVKSKLIRWLLESEVSTPIEPPVLRLP